MEQSMSPKRVTWLAGFAALMVLSGTAAPAGEGDAFQIDPRQNLLREVPATPSATVGTAVADLSFKDIQCKAHYLEDVLRNGPAVFIFLSTECPLAQRYSLRLSRLHEDFSPRGVSFFGVYANADETRQTVAGLAREANMPFPLVKDVHGYLARKLGATMTPQVLVIDSQQILRYRGAIDDNRLENRVKRSYLRDALMALLAKRPVEVAQTDSHGCTLHLPSAATVEKVTYNEHVARILQDHCQACHRPGQVGPFSLTSFEKARSWGKEIVAYTQARLMPPWKAEAGFGAFQNERRLSDDELALLGRWVKEGMPRGDADDLPPPPRFHAGWPLGKPDHVLEMPEEYTVGPEGEDDYRHFIIPTRFDTDLYVAALDVRPGNPQVVHHVIAFVDTTGKARELDREDPGPGFTRAGGPGFVPASRLGGWAPGRTPILAPAGTGTLTAPRWRCTSPGSRSRSASTPGPPAPGTSSFRPARSATRCGSNWPSRSRCMLCRCRRTCICSAGR
jgi:mono/diheme cytochrome c family protein